MLMFQNCPRALKCRDRYICPSRYIRLFIYSCGNESRTECSGGVHGAAPARHTTRSWHPREEKGSRTWNPTASPEASPRVSLLQQVAEPSHAQIKAGWRKGRWEVWVWSSPTAWACLFKVSGFAAAGMFCCKSLPVNDCAQVGLISTSFQNKICHKSLLLIFFFFFCKMWKCDVTFGSSFTPLSDNMLLFFVSPLISVHVNRHFQHVSYESSILDDTRRDIWPNIHHHYADSHWHGNSKHIMLWPSSVYFCMNSWCTLCSHYNIIQQCQRSNSVNRKEFFSTVCVNELCSITGVTGLIMQCCLICIYRSRQE